MELQCRACHLRHDIIGRPPGTVIQCRCGATMVAPEPGGDTIALTCPQCGGTADHKLARCQHCDTALATIRCPACFGLAFEGNNHCGHCGDILDAPARVTHANGHAALPCPACKDDMSASIVKQTLIDGCNNCGGVWLDHYAFEQLLNDRTYTALVETLNIPRRHLSDNKTKYTGEERESFYVQCPVCEVHMHRRNYASTSGIVLDVCADHGIWFDANELSQALQKGPITPQEANVQRTTAYGAELKPRARPVPVMSQRNTYWGEIAVEGVLAILRLIH